MLQHHRFTFVRADEGGIHISAERLPLEFGEEGIF